MNQPRRAFLRQSFYFTVAAATGTLAACGGGDDDEPTGSFAFPQGVASGDPRPDALVCWTRCRRTDGEAASATVDLRLQVATDEGFGKLVADVRLAAEPRWDHTVRAKVTGLAAGTQHFYRFVAGSDTSATGRARTAPADTATPQQLRFAWMSCQDWSVNHWEAMRLLAQEDLDFVVHLGDYIYETVGATFQSGAAETAHGAIRLPDGQQTEGGRAVAAATLADYRMLYRTYRGDARLQAVHARAPMIAVWDDHEFSDDAWQDHQTYTNANPQQTQRRRAANQAWAEYMPVDWGDVSFSPDNAAYDNIRIYRELRFGTLLHLVMTDERLYRDDHVVPEAAVAQQTGADPVAGNSAIGARYFVPQTTLLAVQAQKTAALGRAPSILGGTQAAWWKSAMRGATATWKVWGNEVTLNRMWVDLRAQAPAPYNQVYVVNADGWDGYPAHRAELMGFLKANAIRNVVAVTGDLHAFQCGVIRDDADPAKGTPVMVDLVGAGISSGSFYSYLKAGAAGTPLTPLVATPQIFDGVLRANNPDFAYVDHDAQGFAMATVTPQSMVATYVKVNRVSADGTLPATLIAKRTRITLACDSVAPQVQDGV